MRSNPFVVYAVGHRPPDQYKRHHVVTWPEAHMAAVWVRTMINGAEAEQPSVDRLVLATPHVELRSDRLSEILAAEPSSWVLPDEYARWILRFKYGTWDEVNARPDEPVSSAVVRPEREHRPERPIDYVTITELCAASGMPAMQARAALRASGRIKPAYGWSFAPDEVPVIKKICGMS